MTEDRALVDAVLANEPGAFARLVRAYQGLCWHIVQRMVRQPEDAAELCQEVFLRVHQTLHQFRHESPLRAWIGRVAYHVALRHLERKRIPIADLGEDEDGASPLDNLGDGSDLEGDIGQAQLDTLLHAAIDRLPPTQRTVLTLYHLDELSVAEIAVVTGMATGTIKSHLFRARLRLRGALAPPMGVTP
ncbi:sigma-70 family RNA polymerase sigma factor [Bacillus sp. NP157]|nr:sigma-70 family RNA polymerase sigma factor [Bacillus sp. NP157]